MRTSKFVSAIVAGSIAISAGFAAPAFAGADRNQLARILLGAVAVGAIAHQVNKNKKSREAVVHHNQYKPHQPRVVYDRHRPRTCLRKKYTQHGWKTFYSQKCLKQHRNRHGDRDWNHNHKHHDKHARRHRHDNHRHDHRHYDDHDGRFQYKNNDKR